MMRLLRTTVIFTALAATSVLAVVRLRPLSWASAAAARAAAAQHAQAGRAGGRRQWLRIIVFLTGLAAGGLLVVVSGVVPLKASAGHWPITAWFLHFAMRRSVATLALGLQAPALDDPRLVLQGAGHYETGCRPCHGSPEFPHPRMPRHMTPHPPSLPPRIASWEPAALFYIVKHGVKFTGMPAWPAPQRDDEVWAMVAFLRTLPALQAEEYRRLVYGENSPTGDDAPIRRGVPGPEQVPRAVTASCGRCHGVDGHGRSAGAFPRLAGQRPAYLDAALQAYARGERHSGIMAPIAAGLSRDEMRELALYYGGLQEPWSLPSPTSQVATPAIARGKAIASHGIPRQRVPACVHCHGPGATRRNPLYPVLAGQYADYLVLQLELFNKGQRGGSAYGHLMRPVAARLTPEQRRDVALYYASLPTARDGPTR